ncbi:hypothetical protein MRX96_046711 [Rhipicephalus microplus]
MRQVRTHTITPYATSEGANLVARAAPHIEAGSRDGDQLVADHRARITFTARATIGTKTRAQSRETRRAAAAVPPPAPCERSGEPLARPPKFEPVRTV